MEIVVDTNILLSVVLKEASRNAIVEKTRGASLIAPEFLFYELGNAISAMWKRGRIDETTGLEAMDIASGISVRLLPVAMNEALLLSSEYGIYAYDAYFLQLAKSRGVPLLTLDRKMARIGKDEAIDVWEV